MSTPKKDPNKRYIARHWKSTVSGQFYFHLVSGNGEIVVASEGYKRRRSALKIIKTLMPVVKRVEELPPKP